MNRFLMNWRTQLRKGIVEFCVLRVVEDAPVYGYDIVRQLRALEVLVISEGTIYPVLSRLRREGLLRAYLKESPEGPARKYYQLTSHGSELLSEMRKVWTAMARGVEDVCGTKGQP